MSPLLLAALILIWWRLSAARFAGVERRWSLPALPPATAPIAGLLLVAAFGAQLGLVHYQAAHDGVREAWFATTPFAFTDDAYKFGPNHRAISLLAFAVVIVQTAALYWLVSALSKADRALLRGCVVATTVVLATMAILAAAVSSGDVFGYVGLGMFGTEAYARPAGMFSGEYARVFDHYPVRPTVYGPVWVVWNATLVSLGTTFAAKIVVLRVAGAALVIALAALARALGASRTVQLAVLCNPFLWFQYVTNAHNDVLGLVLILLAALALKSGRPWAGVILITAAGLVKLPFVVIGAVAFALPGVDRRAVLRYAAVSVVACVAASLAFGGHAYIDALHATAQLRGRQWDFKINAIKGMFALYAVGVSAIAVARRRTLAYGGWFFPALAPMVFPWYLAWTVPYALFFGTGALETLLALPIAGAFADRIYDLDDIALLVPAALAGAAALDIIRRSSRPPAKAALST